jgi:hypothetical protein
MPGRIGWQELQALFHAQLIIGSMREGMEEKAQEVAERIRRGAVIEPGPYRFDVKTLRVEEE